MLVYVFFSKIDLIPLNIDQVVDIDCMATSELNNCCNNYCSLECGSVAHN